jgi:hypothetical protein
VESSCELGNEPSGSIKCWELPSSCTSCGLSSGSQLHRISLLVVQVIRKQVSVEDIRKSRIILLASAMALSHSVRAHFNPHYFFTAL